MLAKTESVALIGADGLLIQVEVEVADGGLPGLRIVGLPSKSVMEAEQRVRSGLEATGEHWPGRRITANLAPGALRKEGSHFDLAIALGIVAGNNRLPLGSIDGWLAVGEVALDGSLRSVRGTLAAALACRTQGKRGLICPAVNGAEAAIVEGVEVVPVANLRECLAFFRGEWTPPLVVPAVSTLSAPAEDLSEVRGHDEAKKALEIAAAGGHNLLLVGPPGTGKTMLARRLPGILPEMSCDEAIEATRVYSVAGLLPEPAALMSSRPFRAPHHHVSMAGLIGGGKGLAQPGEVSLAHHGVLFLDEIPLFRGEVLESLRGPLEDGRVRIARSAGVVSYPARFSLIAAMNPCPCGFSQDPVRRCTCRPMQLTQYRTKLSGPLIDRFDIQARMPRPTRSQLMGPSSGDTSGTIRSRVEAARKIQSARYGPTFTNASCSHKELVTHLELTREARDLLNEAVDGQSLTGRGLVRVMRVARTIADLEERDEVDEVDISVALSFRLSGLRGEGSA